MNPGVWTASTAAIASLAISLLLSMPAPAVAQTTAAAPEAPAEPAVPRWLVPDRWYLQAGAGTDVDSASAGLIWELDRGWTAFGGARVTATTEVSIGRWHVDDSGGSASSTNTQFGFTPTLRMMSSGPLGIFGEVGIGINVIAPLYRTDDKRFSTAFNFGNHIGVGFRPWGSTGAELSLRAQHFSNAGIKHPNPGENFLQLRWSQPL